MNTVGHTLSRPTHHPYNCHSNNNNNSSSSNSNNNTNDGGSDDYLSFLVREAGRARHDLQESAYQLEEQLALLEEAQSELRLWRRSEEQQRAKLAVVEARLASAAALCGTLRRGDTVASALRQRLARRRQRNAELAAKISRNNVEFAATQPLPTTHSLSHCVARAREEPRMRQLQRLVQAAQRAKTAVEEELRRVLWVRHVQARQPQFPSDGGAEDERAGLLLELAQTKERLDRQVARQEALRREEAALRRTEEGLAQRLRTAVRFSPARAKKAHRRPQPPQTPWLCEPAAVAVVATEAGSG